MPEETRFPLELELQAVVSYHVWRCWEWNFRPLEEGVFLTAEPRLQCSKKIFFSYITCVVLYFFWYASSFLKLSVLWRQKQKGIELSDILGYIPNCIVNS